MCPASCIVKGCRPITHHYPGHEPRTFHLLKCVPLLASKWTNICNFPEEKIKDRTALCSRHFENDCYTTNSPTKRRKLLLNYHPLPTLFLSEDPLNPHPNDAAQTWKRVIDFVTNVKTEEEKEEGQSFEAILKRAEVRDNIKKITEELEEHLKVNIEISKCITTSLFANSTSYTISPDNLT
jgi:hypothetical protein